MIFVTKFVLRHDFQLILTAAAVCLLFLLPDNRETNNDCDVTHFFRFIETQDTSALLEELIAAKAKG